MIFGFHILVLINYISDTNNYVLKRITDDTYTNANSNAKHVILQDLRDILFPLTTQKSFSENITNTRSRNLKVNLFDRKLSDEMLLIRQNIYGRDSSTLPTNTKSTIGPPTLKLKSVDLAEDPNFKVQQNVEDDIDFSHLFPKDKDNTSQNTVVSSEIKSSCNVQQHHNQSVNKIVDLRSLSRHAPSHIDDLHMDVSVNSCTCTPSSIKTNPKYDPFTYSSLGTTDHGGCTRTTVSFTLMPYYVSYQPYFYYPPNIYGMLPDEDMYYEDDKDRNYFSYSDDDGYKKDKRKKKKHRHGKEKIGKYNYDVPRETKLKWNTAFFEAQPNKLVKDLVDDLLMIYPDSVGKKCYCSSSSNYSPLIGFQIILLLVIFW